MTSRAATIHCLPDSALVGIFGALDLLPRQRAVPLVCRRWCQLAVTPQLLSSISVDLSQPYHVWQHPVPVLRRARSFSNWLLARAAGNVRQLSIRFDPASGEHWGQQFHVNVNDLWTEVMGAVAVCGWAGSLRELRLEMRVVDDRRLPGWVATALQGLRRLRILAQECSNFTVVVPLAGLTGLEELHLEGQPLLMKPTASLPPSLTKMHLGGIPQHETLPPQMSSLTKLRHLKLEHVEGRNGAEVFAVLSQLGASLRRLDLVFCRSLPPAATLSTLTALEDLHLIPTIEESQGETEMRGRMEEALEAMPQLRRLLVNYDASLYCIQYDSFPSNLARLTQLQCFGWNAPAPLDPALPPGPWLSGLSALAVAPAVISHNAEALVTAGSRLQLLIALDPFMATKAAHASWDPFAARAVLQLPALRCLIIEDKSASTAFGQRQEIGQMQQEAAAVAADRPELVVRHRSSGFLTYLWDDWVQ